jgi:hypothetical protein
LNYTVLRRGIVVVLNHAHPMPNAIQ